MDSNKTTPAKILVVEDDKFLLEAYKTKLGSSGFEVKMATDGEEALMEYSSFSPDVVILDLKMPKTDGFFFMEKLAQVAQPQKALVIVASNSEDKVDIERAMKLGASDYVIKSNLSMKGLVEKINGLLRSRPHA